MTPDEQPIGRHIAAITPLIVEIDEWVVAYSARGEPSVHVLPPLGASLVAMSTARTGHAELVEWLDDAGVLDPDSRRNVAAAVMRVLDLRREADRSLDAESVGHADGGGWGWLGRVCEPPTAESPELALVGPPASTGVDVNCLSVVTSSARVARALADWSEPTEMSTVARRGPVLRADSWGGARDGLAIIRDEAGRPLCPPGPVRAIADVLRRSADELAEPDALWLAGGGWNESGVDVIASPLDIASAILGRPGVANPRTLMWRVDGGILDNVRVRPGRGDPMTARLLAAAPVGVRVAAAVLPLMVGSRIPAGTGGSVAAIVHDITRRLIVEEGEIDPVPNKVLPLASPRRTPTVAYSFRRRDERMVDCSFSEANVASIVREGYGLVGNVIAAREAAELGDIVERLAVDEQPKEEVGRGTYYVNELHTKDPRFEQFIEWQPGMGLAQALLGPQLRLWLNARIAYGGEGATTLPWHIHMPPPTPLPPWYSEPHSVNFLIYLDDVTPDEGALIVSPGTHLASPPPPSDVYDAPAVELFPRRGECVVVHGNLWHRTGPPTTAAASRRMLFVSYTAAWVTAEVADARDSNWAGRWPPTEGQRDELLGRFVW